MKRSVAFSGALIALVAATCAGSVGSPSVTVVVQEMGGSGLSGTATFRSLGPGTQVELQVRGGDAFPFLAAHIHDGACDAMNPPPQYRLNAVDHGASVTIIPGSLPSLFHGSPLVLNRHPPSEELPMDLMTPRSAVREIGTTLACGELRE